MDRTRLPPLLLLGTALIRTLIAIPLLALASCASIPPMPGWSISHATGRHTRSGREMHTCFDGSECEEGYACTRFGCEFCGDDDGVETRCTDYEDGSQIGIERE
jgi:hypothetical protein